MKTLSFKSLLLFISSSIVITFIAGCGNSSASSSSDVISLNELPKMFPVLVSEGGMDVDDFRDAFYDNSFIYDGNYTDRGSPSLVKSGVGVSSVTLTSNLGHSVPSNLGGNISSLALGAKVSLIDSSYENTTVFDYGALIESQNLIGNLSSATTAISSIVTGNTQTSKSSSLDLRFDASASGGATLPNGVGFSAQAKGYYENKTQSLNSANTATLQMFYGVTGAYMQIMSKVGPSQQEFNDLSKYLSGVELTANQLGEYINYDYVNHNLISTKNVTLTRTNEYGQIQVINAFETAYSDLNNAYQNSTDAASKNQMQASMLKLKKLIKDGIQNFLSVNGTHFVSNVNLTKYAVANGSADLTSDSTNTINAFGVAVAASVSAVAASGGVGVSNDTSIGKGIANLYQNISVSSTSVPSGTVDISSWSSTIMGQLKDTTKSTITVPPISIPAITSPELPKVPAQAKNPLTPPDSCFKSYEEWRSYKDGLRQRAQIPPVLPQPVPIPAPVAPVVPVTPAKISVVNAIVTALGAQSSQVDVVDEYSNELEELRRVTQNYALGDDGNLHKLSTSGKAQSLKTSFENPIMPKDLAVYGYDLTPYDEVIPQLRPNFSVDIGAGYVNISKALIFQNQLQKLDSYMLFLSKMGVSGISANMYASYHKFEDTTTTDIFNAVQNNLKTGQDLSDNYINALYAKINPSSLSGALNSVALAGYVSYLLTDPVAYKTWFSAPGGYAPFTMTHGKTEFAAVGGYYPWIPATGSSNLIANYIADAPMNMSANYPLNDPTINPLDFYVSLQNNKYYNTPWFPIFVYNRSWNIASNTTIPLVFVQYAGPYQMIHTKNGTIRVNGGNLSYGLGTKNAVQSLVAIFNSFNDMSKITVNLITLPGAALPSSIIDTYIVGALNSFTPTINDFNNQLDFGGAVLTDTQKAQFQALKISSAPFLAQGASPGIYGMYAPDSCSLPASAFATLSVDIFKKDYDQSKQGCDITKIGGGNQSKRNLAGELGTTGLPYMYDMIDPRLSYYNFEVVVDSTHYRDDIYLLPINSSTCGDKFKRAFSYSIDIPSINGTEDAVIPQSVQELFIRGRLNR